MKIARVLTVPAITLALLATSTAWAAPRQRIESPWNRWIAIQMPALVTVNVSGGTIKATEAATAIVTGTSPYASAWRYSPDRQHLIANVLARYGCEGTQVHQGVGLTTNWDSRSAGASGKYVTRTFNDVKLGSAAELQQICDVKGTWRSFTKGSTLVVRKEFTANYEVTLSATCKAPLAPTRHPKTREAYQVITVCDTVTHDYFKLTKLNLLWSGANQDNLSSNQSSQSGYSYVRREAWMYKQQVPGTIPLRLFHSPARKDYFTTATAKGVDDAKKAGYQDKGVIGYVFSAQSKGTRPLKLFWSSGRGDNMSTATKQGQLAAQSAGYSFVRNEGYVIY